MTQSVFQYQAYAGPDAVIPEPELSRAPHLQVYPERLPPERLVDEGYLVNPISGLSTETRASVLQIFPDSVETTPPKVAEGSVWFPLGRSTDTQAWALQDYPSQLPPERLVERGFIWTPSGRSTTTQAWALQDFVDQLPPARLYEGQSIYTSWDLIVPAVVPDVAALLQTYPDRLPPPRLVDRGFIWTPLGRSTDTQAWSLQSYPDQLPPSRLVDRGFTWTPLGRSTDTRAWSLQTYPDQLPPARFYEGAFVYDSWEDSVAPPAVVPTIAALLQTYPSYLPPARLVDEGFLWTPLGRSTETQAWALATYPAQLPPERLVERGLFTYTSWFEIIPPAPDFGWFVQDDDGFIAHERARSVAASDPGFFSFVNVAALVTWTNVGEVWTFHNNQWFNRTFTWRCVIRSETGDSVSARLYDLTAGAGVGSSGSTASTSQAIIVAGTFTPVDGHTYQTQVGS